MVDRSYETNEGAPEYENSFTALPARLPTTPHRLTHRPRLDATQVGIIAGPSGEEIHTDHYGRVKLWFPWDRRAKKDGQDTCWVRVAQNWAGANWGGQVIPRVGMEAMVAYLDGDPDRPIVVGLVPNPQQKVPYDLPGNKTRMVMRSNSYKSQGRNELTLEDATGQENMFLHAQKDFTHRVLNNHTQRVDANHVTSVGSNQAVEVGSNQKTEVGGSMNMVVGGTGAQALGLMGQLANLAPQTAGLLQQAGDVAGGGGAALAGMAASIASSALGFFTGGGLSGRQGVVAGSDPTQNAGHSLRQAGGAVGKDVGGILSAIPGMLNKVVGSFNTALAARPLCRPEAVRRSFVHGARRVSDCRARQCSSSLAFKASNESACGTGVRKFVRKSASPCAAASRAPSCQTRGSRRSQEPAPRASAAQAAWIAHNRAAPNSGTFSKSYPGSA
jgi:type VI secretion system secreted protein VgrG